MRIKFFTVSLFLCVSCAVYAQQTALGGIKTALNTMFSGLDKTKVPTGFLWDTAVNLVDEESYNGSALTDSNFVSIPIMGDMLHSINSASVGADTICVQDALSRIQRNSSSHSIMVGILFQPYNYIVANALTDSLINYSNGVVHDVERNGVWQNPYGEDVIYGYMIGNDEIANEYVTFTFTNIDSLSTQAFQSVQFDPGDGNGFRTVSIDGTLAVDYSFITDKIVETKLKVTVGAHTYQSHSLLNVVYPVITPDAVGGYVDTLELAATYGDSTYKARLVYSDTITFHKRPLIVSEGFDPWRLLDKSDVHDYSGSTDITVIDSSKDPLDSSSLFSNFDIFYIDWYDCGADIRANAEVLKEVIRWVNNHNQSGEPNIVLGQSMGGLIARYALLDMEHNQELHNTTLFISHDVPYLGANVSPGLLFLYRDLFDLIDTDFGLLLPISKWGDKFMEARRLGSYQSVKQMLPNYVDASNNYDNFVFASLRSYFDYWGFPVGDPLNPLENVAIINGGKTSTGASSLFHSGDKLVDIDITASTSVLSEVLLTAFSLFTSKKNKEFPFVWLPGKSTLKATFSVYPYLSNNCMVAKSNITFTKSFFWLANIEFELYNSSYFAPSTGAPLDSVSCSFYNLKKHSNGFEIDTTQTTWFYTYDAFIDATDSLMFVPVASAMSMPTAYYSDLLSQKPEPRKQTPFDSYVLPASTTGHIKFYYGLSKWLKGVLSKGVDGPGIGVTGDSYSMTNTDPSGLVWSTTNTSIAVIDSLSGELTVINPGVVDVVAVKDSLGGVISKRKRIHAGLPRMTLNHTSVSSGYEVTADYIYPSVREFINTSGLRDSLLFKWQLTTNTGSLTQTVADTLKPFVAVVDSTASFVSVSLLAVYRGIESEVASTIIRNPDTYLPNITRIRLMGGSSITYNQRYTVSGYSGNPPCFIIRENVDNPVLPSPFALQTVNVLGQTYTGTIVIKNRVPYIVYDIFNSGVVAEYLSSVNVPGASHVPLLFYICSSTGTIEQVVEVPVMWYGLFQ